MPKRLKMLFILLILPALIVALVGAALSAESVAAQAQFVSPLPEPLVRSISVPGGTGVAWGNLGRIYHLRFWIAGQWTPSGDIGPYEGEFILSLPILQWEVQELGLSGVSIDPESEYGKPPPPVEAGGSTQVEIFLPVVKFH